MTDESLVALYANGNNSAFDVLLNRYKKSIYSYIFYIVHNRDLAEDIFQDTFLKVIMTIKQGRYTDTGKFKAWITRIAHNLIIDNFRQERYENTISNDEVEVDLLNDMKLCDSNIEDEMIQKQVFLDIKKLIMNIYTQNPIFWCVIIQFLKNFFEWPAPIFIAELCAKSTSIITATSRGSRQTF